MFNFKISIFLFGIIFSKVVFSAAPINIPGIPGGVPHAVVPINQAFVQLRQHANQQSILDVLNSINNLKEELFSLPNMNGPILDQAPLLARLRAIRDRLNAADPRIKPMLRNLRGSIGNRIDLARIDQNVHAGDGVRGDFNHPNFNAHVQNSLGLITGVIFHITQSLDNAGAIHESVESVGSGTLVNLNAAAVPNIQNLVSGHGQELNGVLTCAHVLESSNAVEIYFVPSSELNLLWGLPNTVAGVGMGPVDLLNFLRTDAHSYKITEYTLWQRRPPAAAAVAASGNSMLATKPMYLENEDMVVARIVPNPGHAFIIYNGAALAAVNFLKHGPGVGLNEYFAIGYPGCNHYDEALPPFANIFDPLLTDDFVPSPLFITKSSLARGVVALNNGQISHRAPAAAGMSGGPLLRTYGNTINVFGVITQGIDDDESGCKLE